MAVLFVLHNGSDNSSAEATESGQCGPDAYYTYSDGTLEISGSGRMYDYVNERAPWYDHHNDIIEIIIGDDITGLGRWAFYECWNLYALTIPITVNSVVSDTFPAFQWCPNVVKVSFTPGNGGWGYDYAAYNGDDSWYAVTPWQFKSHLYEINFADGITHIGNDAFRGLKLTKFVLPDSVTSLGNHCFFNCTELTDLTIPVSLNSYGNETYPAFQGCMAIKNVIFTRGNGVPFDYSHWWGSACNTKLAPWNMNPYITKKIVISDDVTSLGKYMFLGCNISELTIPVNVKCGDSKAFCVDGEGFTNLTKLTITKGNGCGPDYTADTFRCNPWNTAAKIDLITVEEGVTRLGAYMFYGCVASKIVLPDSLSGLGKQTFAHTTIKELALPISLNAVWLDNKVPIQHMDTYMCAFDNVSGLEKITFTPGTGYGQDYAAYSGQNCYYIYTPWYICRDTLKEIVFEEGIKHIGSDAFRELNITSLVIPNSVESLGCHTFYNCSKLTDLTIPITLDSICSERYPAFQGCDAVNALRFTIGTDGIGFDYGNYAPFWCTPYRHPDVITLDRGITYIGTKTFIGYTFIGSDGEVLQPVAECLSGHVFIKADDGTYMVSHSAAATGDPTAAVYTDIRRL